jgi:hypothetical protein
MGLCCSIDRITVHRKSAATRAFLERPRFPYLKYARKGQSLFPRRINTAMVWTMNVPEEMIQPIGCEWLFNRAKMMLEKHFGPCEVLLSTNTLRYSDYDQFESEMFDKEAKYRRHAKVFPKDCRKAFALGVRIASGPGRQSC